ncbi:hypothetical protein FRC18_009264 [Serendipita sp. 400]|nr:hypothetical protein FRC18_009264 [Serendipita sp. 400]
MNTMHPLHHNSMALDTDPPRTPTTAAGDGPTSSNASPMTGHSGLAVIRKGPAPDEMMGLHVIPAETSLKTKPSTSKGAKADSPPLQLPQRAPPQPTVRLEFFIDDPEEYEVNILALAKTSGQRLPTPPPPDKESSDSDDDDEPPEPHPIQTMIPGPEGITEAPVVQKRRKRRNRDYDLDDPFIDDVDLAIDERTHFAQTTLQGFYVSSGDVALVEQEGYEPSAQINFNSNNLNSNKRGPGRPPKRAAGPLNATLIARTLLEQPLGNHKNEAITAQAAIAASMELGIGPSEVTPPILTEEPEMQNGNGQKRKRDSTPSQDSSDPNKRRRLSKPTFHPDLEDELTKLQKAISKHDFANKGKFPPDLKPVLLEAAIKAINVGEYNDNFFNYLPKIFPYNRFTMMKLTKRLTYKDHIRLIHERQAVLLEELTKMVNEGMDQAVAEYERSVQLWEERKGRKKLEVPNGMEGVEPTNPPAGAISGNEGDHEKEGDGEDGEDDKDKPPSRRYRMNEAMRGYLWALVQLSNEVCTLTNEKNHLEGSKDVVSEQSQRKELYKKVLQAFPDQWMNTGAISREVSMMKKKMESATAPPKPDEAAPSQPQP